MQQVVAINIDEVRVAGVDGRLLPREGSIVVASPRSGRRRLPLIRYRGIARKAAISMEEWVHLPLGIRAVTVRIRIIIKRYGPLVLRPIINLSWPGSRVVTLSSVDVACEVRGGLSSF